MYVAKYLFVFIFLELNIAAKAIEGTQHKCIDGWDTVWYNNNSPSTKLRSDREHVPFSVKCTGTPKVRCKDEKNETLLGHRNDTILKYVATCITPSGLVCRPWANSTELCPDFSIQFGCICPELSTGPSCAGCQTTCMSIVIAVACVFIHIIF